VLGIFSQTHLVTLFSFKTLLLSPRVLETSVSGYLDKAFFVFKQGGTDDTVVLKCKLLR
jgi:hypothetical protein